MRIELANGLQLEAELDGPEQGTPLVLITGLGLQLTAWPAAFMQGLQARGFRTLRFDNRDAGLSSRVRGPRNVDVRTEAMRSMIGLSVRAPYSLHDMAGDVIGLMDALAMPDAHVVGVSMGGMIGQVLAAGAPQRVRSLTSIMSSSGATRFRFHFTPATRAVLTPPPRGADEARLLDHYVHIWSLISSPGMQASPEVLRERLKADLRRSGGDASGTARQLLAVLHSGDRRRLLRKIAAPTLVLHGDADQLVPLAAGQDTARHIPGARFEAIAGMGHDLPEPLIAKLVQTITGHCESTTPVRR